METVCGSMALKVAASGVSFKIPFIFLPLITISIGVFALLPCAALAAAGIFRAFNQSVILSRSPSISYLPKLSGSKMLILPRLFFRLSTVSPRPPEP